MASHWPIPSHRAADNKCRSSSTRRTFANWWPTEKDRGHLIWRSTTPVPRAKGRVVGDAVKYNAVATRVMKDNGIATDDMYAFAKARLKEIQRPANVHFTREGPGPGRSRCRDHPQDDRSSNRISATISEVIPCWRRRIRPF
ncbi:MAG: hypothetical protein CM1200mP2_45340 [Planctomycetaceae bacterium]|nr:MAG: hypothetical protein CM1200mP2_45340 [Planctomycetaceae bacterium]